MSGTPPPKKSLTVGPRHAGNRAGVPDNDTVGSGGDRFFWQRWLLAACGLGLIAVGMVGSRQSTEPGMYLAIIRAGLVCCVVWLAWPQIAQLNTRWRPSRPVCIGLVALLMIAALRPRWLATSTILGVILWILHSLARSRWSRWFSS